MRNTLENVAKDASAAAEAAAEAGLPVLVLRFSETSRSLLPKNGSLVEKLSFGIQGVEDTLLYKFDSLIPDLKRPEHFVAVFRRV